MESLRERSISVNNGQQLFVRDGNDTIYMLRQLGYTILSPTPTHQALKTKRLGNNCYGEGTNFSSALSYYWSCTGASTAPHTSSNKYHIGPLQSSLDFITILLGGLGTYLWAGTCPFTLSSLTANLNTYRSQGLFQHLSICINNNKFDSLNTGGYHTVNSIVATAANTNDLYDSIQIIYIEFCKINSHENSSTNSTIYLNIFHYTYYILTLYHFSHNCAIKI